MTRVQMVLSKGLFALRPYDPSARRVYQPAALPERIVYPILAFGGAKLIALDSWQGRSMTLFASLVASSRVALILAPQLVGHWPRPARARTRISSPPPP
jgi:hypothetical protein